VTFERAVSDMLLLDMTACALNVSHKHGTENAGVMRVVGWLFGGVYSTLNAVCSAVAVAAIHHRGNRN